MFSCEILFCSDEVLQHSSRVCQNKNRLLQNNTDWPRTHPADFDERRITNMRARMCWCVESKILPSQKTFAFLCLLLVCAVAYYDDDVTRRRTQGCSFGWVCGCDLVIQTVEFLFSVQLLRFKFRIYVQFHFFTSPRNDTPVVKNGCVGEWWSEISLFPAIFWSISVRYNGCSFVFARCFFFGFKIPSVWSRACVCVSVRVYVFTSLVWTAYGSLRI